MKKLKLLIIGGTGFIGRHIVKDFQNDYEIFLFHRGNTKDIFFQQYTSVIGDRKNIRDFKSQFEKIKPDIIIDIIPYNHQEAWDLVHTFKNITPRIIALSSSDVYRAFEIIVRKEDQIVDGNLKEESELRHEFFPYRDIDMTGFKKKDQYDKILVENILMAQKEFDTTILRLGAVHGEYDWQGKLKELIHPMLQGEKEISLSPIYAHWKWTRIYVKNLVEAIRVVIENPKASKNEIFNIANQETFSQIEVLQKLKTLINWKGEVKLDKNLDEKFQHFQQPIFVNSEKIRNQLGYQEKYTFEEGLVNTIAFMKNQLK